MVPVGSTRKNTASSYSSVSADSDVQLPPVEPQLPARQVTHVAIEEAIGVADRYW